MRPPEGGLDFCHLSKGTGRSALTDSVRLRVDGQVPLRAPTMNPHLGSIATWAFRPLPPAQAMFRQRELLVALEYRHYVVEERRVGIFARVQDALAERMRS